MSLLEDFSVRSLKKSFRPRLIRRYVVMRNVSNTKRKYSMSVFAGATVINMFPSFLRPIVGPLVALFSRKHLLICQRICLPVVEERLTNNEWKMKEPDFQ